MICRSDGCRREAVEHSPYCGQHFTEVLFSSFGPAVPPRPQRVKRLSDLDLRPPRKPRKG